jgi:hypothetical protein
LRAAVDGVDTAALRETLAGSVPRVPIGYLEAVAPEPASLATDRAAFLQLSEAYGPQARAARELGWPVGRLYLDHLAMMTSPDVVAEAIEVLIASLAV